MKTTITLIYMTGAILFLDGARAQDSADDESMALWAKARSLHEMIKSTRRSKRMLSASTWLVVARGIQTAGSGVLPKTAASSEESWSTSLFVV